MTDTKELRQRHDFIEEIRTLVASDLSIIPIADLITKRPAKQWSYYQKERAEDFTVTRWFNGEAQYPGVAIVTGYGGVGALDVDADHDGGKVHDAWRAAVEQEAPGLLDTLVVERTRSGGRHYWYRCDEVEKGRDLAKGKDTGALIELKELGRICVCAPTPGYTLLSGTLTALPRITPAQRSILITCAQQFHEDWKKPRIPDHTLRKDDHKPGDDYSARATYAETLQLLLDVGWTISAQVGPEHCRLERPGKHEGSTSGDLLFHEGCFKFFCYTSNADPFKAMCAYVPYQIRALTVWAHDPRPWIACSRELRELGYGERKRTGKTKEEGAHKPDQLELAHLWVTEFSPRWAWDPEYKRWRQWNGMYWAKAEDFEESALASSMATYVQQIGRKSVQSYSQVTSLMSLCRNLTARSFTHTQTGESTQGWINFSNGMVDMRPLGSGLLEPHDPSYNLTHGVSYPYEPGRPTPRIEEFLEQSMPDPVARVVYRAQIGLALMQNVSLHKALVILGPRGSGKSTFLKLANLTCGNGVSDSGGAVLFETDSEGLRSRASWRSRYLVCVDELPVTALKHEEVTKAMLAHMGVPMRALYGNEITNNAWIPKIMTSANEAPRTQDISGALARRLIYIAAPRSLEDDNLLRDLNLIGKLEEELPGFAAQCLEAARRVLADGRYPESLQMKALNWQVELESDALKAFITLRCVFEPNAWAANTALWNAYGLYCGENGHTGQLSQIQMKKRILSRFASAHGLKDHVSIPTGGIHRAHGIKGLRLKTKLELVPDQEDEEFQGLRVVG